MNEELEKELKKYSSCGSDGYMCGECKHNFKKVSIILEKAITQEKQALLERIEERIKTQQKFEDTLDDVRYILADEKSKL